MESENEKMDFKDLQIILKLEGLTFGCAAGSEDRTIAIISSLGNNLWVQILINCVSWCRPLSFKFLGVLFSATGKVLISLSDFFTFHQYLLTKNIISINDFEYPPNPNLLKSAEEYEHPTKEGTVQCYIERDDVQQFTKHIVLHNVSMDSDEKLWIDDWQFNTKEFAPFIIANTQHE